MTPATLFSCRTGVFARLLLGFISFICACLLQDLAHDAAAAGHGPDARAGGDPLQLQGPLALALLAISAGAVFLGANSYIGNATDFMAKSIAASQWVPMPSLFGFMSWVALSLLPLFVLIRFLFFEEGR